MSNVRWGGAGLVIAGVLFAAYPILRPYAAEEVSLAGAEALASNAWVASHTFAMVAFILLVPGLRALFGAGQPHRRVWGDDRGTSARRGPESESRGAGSAGPAQAAVVLTGLGTALVLPYYGAETFALQAAAAHVVATGDATALEAAEAFRWAGLPIGMFGLGLLLLAGAGAMAIIWSVRLARRPGRGVARLGMVLTGLGLVTYLPQFFAAPAGRIGHGLVLATGLVLLGAALARPVRGERYDATTITTQVETSSSVPTAHRVH